MTAVVIALEGARAHALAEELELEGVEIASVVAPAGLDGQDWSGIDALLAPAVRGVLTARLIATCDRAGVRIVPLGDAESRLLGRLGLPAALPESTHGSEIARVLAADAPATAVPQVEHPRRIITVWGPHGAPGRSTVAIQLAAELARSTGRTALVDADTTSPAIALLLGLGDDAPGVAAACRRAGLGGLDAAELSRLAATVETASGPLEVLAGLNRPGRWPELSAERLRGALRACRDWAEHTVVDVAAALDADDEVTWDMEGPRRHAATVAALQEADVVVAVASADPLGIARFLREHAEVRHLVGDTPVRVVVNRVRPGPLGIDARGQVRRTLERFAGITDVDFLPHDQRAADAALLHARPLCDVAARSQLAGAARRLAASLRALPGAPSADTTRGSSRVARWPRRARAVPAG